MNAQLPTLDDRFTRPHRVEIDIERYTPELRDAVRAAGSVGIIAAFDGPCVDVAVLHNDALSLITVPRRMLRPADYAEECAFFDDVKARGLFGALAALVY